MELTLRSVKFHFLKESMNINNINIECLLLSDKHIVGEKSFK